MTRQATIKNSLRLLIACSLTLCSGVRADPVTALVSLLLVEKLAPGDQQRSGREEAYGWREQLTTTELHMLENIRQHPAIDTCITMADNHHPVASYQARKLASFGVLVQQHITNTGALPDLKSLSYQWPARAFRWCSTQAGVTASSDTSLLTYAHNIARVIQFHYQQQEMVALAATD